MAGAPPAVERRDIRRGMEELPILIPGTQQRDHHPECGQRKDPGRRERDRMGGTGALTLSTSFTFLDPRLTQNYCGEAGPDGSPATSNPCPPGLASPVPGEPYPPQAPAGTNLPVAPKFKGNAVARYSLPEIHEWKPFTQAAFVYQTGTAPQLRVEDAGYFGRVPAYGLLDLAAGAEKKRHEPAVPDCECDRQTGSAHAFRGMYCAHLYAALCYSGAAADVYPEIRPEILTMSAAGGFLSRRPRSPRLGYETFGIRDLSTTRPYENSCMHPDSRGIGGGRAVEGAAPAGAAANRPAASLYFREMYLPQLTSGPSSLAWSPDSGRADLRHGRFSVAAENRRGRSCGGGRGRRYERRPWCGRGRGCTGRRRRRHGNSPPRCRTTISPTGPRMDAGWFTAPIETMRWSCGCWI